MGIVTELIRAMQEPETARAGALALTEMQAATDELEGESPNFGRFHLRWTQAYSKLAGSLRIPLPPTDNVESGEA